jgi:3-deoxy-D-manno-octulosonate 8-phosphate phosphatase (KDO 8-P phosphatase)
MSKIVDREIILLISKLKMIIFDFDGVFTDNSVYVDENGLESVRCSRSDGLGLRYLDSLGIKYSILSTEKNPVVTMRAKKLGISVTQGHDEKLPVLKKIAKSHNINLKQIAYVGNDINDLSCLQEVGFPIAVADAYPEVLKLAKYITLKLGGNGAVREVCELFNKFYKQ